MVHSSTQLRRGKTNRQTGLFPAALFNRKAALALAAGAMLLAAHPASADSIWNLVGEANFNTANDWTPNGIPNGVNVQVDNGGTVDITTNETTNDIQTGNGGTAGGNYLQTAGTVTTGGGGGTKPGTRTP